MSEIAELASAFSWDLASRAPVGALQGVAERGVAELIDAASAAAAGAAAGFGVAEAGATASAFEFARGAIAGALVIAATFLAGYAFIQRSGLAFCGFLLVLAAATLEFNWLGLLGPADGALPLLAFAIFAAAVLIFLSAVANFGRVSPIVSGAAFTAALIVAGMGVINLIDRVALDGAIRFAALSAGGAAAVLALILALRGEGGARLAIPGLAMAGAAAALGGLGPLGAVASSGAAALAPHALFVAGVIIASLVAMTEIRSGARSFEGGDAFAGAEMARSFGESAPETRMRADFDRSHAHRERAEIVIDSQLARVLDYAGVAIWDWSEELAEQTDSLGEILRADSDAPFTPEAFRAFIHKRDVHLLDSEAFLPKDGPFDVRLTLFDGRRIRMRGARASENGALSRVVAFIELLASADGAVAKEPARKSEPAGAPAARAAAASAGADAFDPARVSAAFQPIVALPGKRIVGFEALARSGAAANALSGEALVAAAQAAGQSEALLDAMLAEAARFLAKRRGASEGDGVFVAVNVTWSQIRRDDFADRVANALKEHGESPTSLIIELTEAEAIDDPQAAEKVFDALRASGLRLAFDDFGAGFTSLANLRRYAFDYLKIDKSFSAGVEQGGDSATIIRHLTAMAKDLGMKTIIEGVESEEAAARAAELGCDYAQGFALGAPKAERRHGARHGAQQPRAGAPARESAPGAHMDASRARKRVAR